MKPEQPCDDAREQLDEAGLSILMEEYLGIEQARLRGEAMRLNSDADFFYPDTLEEKCQKEFDAHFRRKMHSGARAILRRAAGLAAALLFVAGLCRAVLFPGAEEHPLGAQSGFALPLKLTLALGAAAVIGLALWGLIRDLAARRSSGAPRLAVDAVVVKKRNNVSPCRYIDTPASLSSTTYYITFQVESGDRLELHVSGDAYGRIEEGDRGRLRFQGRRFLDFESVRGCDTMS